MKLGLAITEKALETVDILVKKDCVRKRGWKIKETKSKKSLADDIW